jgi:hypothetical protein
MNMLLLLLVGHWTSRLWTQGMRAFPPGSQHSSVLVNPAARAPRMWCTLQCRMEPGSVLLPCSMRALRTGLRSLVAAQSIHLTHASRCGAPGSPD